MLAIAKDPLRHERQPILVVAGCFFAMSRGRLLTSFGRYIYFLYFSSPSHSLSLHCHAPQSKGGPLVSHYVEGGFLSWAVSCLASWELACSFKHTRGDSVQQNLFMLPARFAVPWKGLGHCMFNDYTLLMLTLSSQGLTRVSVSHWATKAHFMVQSFQLHCSAVSESTCT